jgi:hypothetical protein
MDVQRLDGTMNHNASSCVAAFLLGVAIVCVCELLAIYVW